MKILIISLLLSSQLLCFGQADSVISYTTVISVDGANKDELFIRARSWYNETFKSSKDVLQITDKETGELSGKGYCRVIVKYKSMGSRKYESSCRMFVSVWVKDGKYKYSFSNFQIDVADNAPLSVLTSSEKCPDKWAMVSQSKMNEVWQGAKDGVQIKVDELSDSLKQAMAKKSANDF